MYFSELKILFHFLYIFLFYFIFFNFCRKDPGYIRMNVHDPQNMKDDVGFILFNQIQFLPFYCVINICYDFWLFVNMVYILIGAFAEDWDE